jgi:hypothetical protein
MVPRRSSIFIFIATFVVVEAGVVVIVVVWPHLLKQWKTDTAQEAGE